MKGIINNIINERHVTIFMAVIIAIVGCVSYYYLPRQESPEISIPLAVVKTIYPGASPSDVNDLVTSKIEEALVELDGYDEINGVSEEGFSVVSVFFYDDVDYDTAIQDVRNAVNDVQVELPTGAFRSEVVTDNMDTAGIIISLSGEKYSYEQLVSFGETFKYALMDVDGISKLTVEGELDKEIKVEIDISKLNLMNLSMPDIISTFQAQNLEIPSGSIETEQGKVTVKTPGIFTSLEDVKRMVIAVSAETGVVTRISDVADVYMGLEENVNKYKQNGNNAVLLTAYFQSGKNVVLIGKDVRQIIDDVKTSLPEDLLIEEVVYQPTDVDNSTSDFMNNLFGGIALVMVVVFMGMGFRNAMVVSVAIPMSILIAFIAMYFIGIEIHQMSLAGLIIALGILVDNAVVISDGVQSRIDSGEGRVQAAIGATKAFSVPIFSATLTTVASFLPLLMIPGAPGQFMFALPMIVIISVAASYLVAMTLTPALSATIFKKTNKEKAKGTKTRDLLISVLRKSLKNRLKTVIGMFILLIMVVQILVPLLPQQFFPTVDKDIFYIEMSSERSGDIDATEDLTDDVIEVLSEHPEITSYTVSIGDGLPKFYITMKASTPSASYAQMLCKFDLSMQKEFENADRFVEYIQDKLNSEISAGKCTVKLLENAEPSEASIVVRVSGNDSDRIREVSKELKKRIEDLEGTTNVRDNLDDEQYQIYLDIDEDVIMSLGILKYDIQDQISTALYGKNATVFRKEGNEYNVNVVSTIEKTDDLGNLMIKSGVTGNKIPLKQFASIDYASKQSKIKTYNQLKTVTISANEVTGYSSTLLEDIIEFEILPDIETVGTKISFDGEREAIADNFGTMGILGIGAIFLIYIILMIQFNSFIHPIIILLTIPLSLIGSIVGLFVFKQPLSMTAFLGIVALVGIVVNNGILLIEYLNETRREGATILQACLGAVEKRFNPIVLSSMTTVLGLLPLAISGSSLFAPMAVALMSGLMLSTFSTMIIVPVFYSLVESRKEEI